MSKKETIEEFLARGGKIKKFDYVPPENEGNLVKSNTVGPPTLYSLDEAELFFAEKRTNNHEKKEPNFSDINSQLIPQELRHILNKGNKGVEGKQ